MKKKCAIILLIVFSSILILSGCDNQNAPKKESAQKVTELKAATCYMPTHYTMVNAFKPWAKELEEKTGGSLKVAFFDPDTLCPDKEAYDSAASGVVDIGATNCGYTAGKFPISEVIELPFMFNSSEVASMTYWEMIQRFPELQNEFKDAKPIFHWTSALMQIITTNKQVKTLEDLKGMTIISITSLSTDFLHHYGANPIEIPMTDAYLALQRNMAQGIMLPIAPAKSFKITDVAKYITIADISLCPMLGVINWDTFNNLTPEQQQIFTEVTEGKLSRRLGQTLDEGSVEDGNWMKEQGIEFYVLPEKEKERWIKAVEPMYQAWLDKMDKKGIKNAQEILDEARRLSNEFASQVGRE